MEIKCYWPLEQLGLVEDIAYQYNDGYTHYIVSGRCGDVIFAANLALLAILFIAGLLLRWGRVRRYGAEGGRLPVRIGVGLLLLLGVLKAVGVGPYMIWYPGQRSGGFIDFKVLNHILEGIWFALLALSLWLGGKAGAALGQRPKQNRNSRKPRRPL